MSSAVDVALELACEDGGRERGGVGGADEEPGAANGMEGGSFVAASRTASASSAASSSGEISSILKSNQPNFTIYRDLQLTFRFSPHYIHPNFPSPTT